MSSRIISRLPCNIQYWALVFGREAVLTPQASDDDWVKSPVNEKPKLFSELEFEDDSDGEGEDEALELKSTPRHQYAQVVNSSSAATDMMQTK
ncbi:hypothetical protein BGX21_002769, partial [Mortierella sp. AD011]